LLGFIIKKEEKIKKPKKEKRNEKRKNPEEIEILKQERKIKTWKKKKGGEELGESKIKTCPKTFSSVPVQRIKIKTDESALLS
jgi:hypothetical protein